MDTSKKESNARMCRACVKRAIHFLPLGAGEVRTPVLFYYALLQKHFGICCEKASFGTDLADKSLPFAGLDTCQMPKNVLY